MGVWVHGRAGGACPSRTPHCPFLVARYPLSDDQPILLDFAERPPGQTRARSERFLRPMQERRSVRDFSDRPVPRVLIEQAVRVAAKAPTMASLSAPKTTTCREAAASRAGFSSRRCPTMGLATLTHTPASTKFLGEILNRLQNERPYILFPASYPAPGAEVPDLERKPLGEILQGNRDGGAGGL